MSRAVHCQIKVDGKVIKGFQAEKKVGGVDVLEGIQVEQLGYCARAAAGPFGVESQAKGTMGPIYLRASVDESTPVLMETMLQNKTVEFTIQMFGAVGGQSKPREYCRIEGYKGRVTAVSIVKPDSTMASDGVKDLVEIELTAPRVIVTDKTDSGGQVQAVLTVSGENE